MVVLAALAVLENGRQAGLGENLLQRQGRRCFAECSDFIDGIAAGWDDVRRIGGVFLLAQMSSRGNLLSEGYTDETIATGAASPHVLGYIGNGSSPDEVSSLREKVGEGKMIWTPGVNLSAAEGVLGQRYGHPSDAIRAGSDGVIVGTGIHGSDDPTAAAKAYADATWAALMSR